MANNTNYPERALRIGTYDKLRQYATGFAARTIECLLVLGPAGVGKSSQLRGALREDAEWLIGNSTPFALFTSLYEYRNRPIVLDDVDALFRHPEAVPLLKAICQTEHQKLVTWNSAAAALQQRNIPTQFTTTSPIAVIANYWPRQSADIKAIEDRAVVLVFQPSALEVHREAANWFWDQEIFDFVGEHLHLIAEPSFRIYLHAWQLRRANIDWREYILGLCLTKTALEVAKLKFDPSFHTVEQRVEAFESAGHGVRSTYFSYSTKLDPAQPPPKIEVRGTPPYVLWATPGPRRLLLRRPR